MGLEEKLNIEEISMNIIAHSGDARSLAFEALRKCREGKIEESESLMEKAEKASVEAHHSQTNLLVSEAQGKKTTISVLLIHAQDHLMNSMLAIDLIKEIIKLEKQRKEEK
ncbi:PTS lactose/cellobiose transporter subunit IIA [Oceanobacillus oncorhynchi]|uniref:PTS lactose/cellobiose transporter subunit IIA n=1 Tax=Oceanobacillus oncorhynchi TaxID=545501 RepID=UPI0034D7447A